MKPCCDSQQGPKLKMVIIMNNVDDDVVAHDRDQN